MRSSRPARWPNCRRSPANATAYAAIWRCFSCHGSFNEAGDLSLRLLNQGHLEGARIRVPVHLSRAPIERPCAAIVAFYDRLLAVIGTPEVFRAGAWSLIAPQPAWPDNPTWRDFISYAWCAREG